MVKEEEEEEDGGRKEKKKELEREEKVGFAHARTEEVEAETLSIHSFFPFSSACWSGP